MQRSSTSRIAREALAALVLAGPPFALGAPPVAAQPLAAQPDFAACVARLEALAIQTGISPETARRVLATVTPLERVIRADRSQPEFVQTFAEYLDARATPARIAAGREALREHRELLAGLTARHGVPGQYIVAFWGLESNYGRLLGNIPVFDSLATLACDERRSRYFSAELVNALEIVERGHAVPEQMVGSWAGAMGQTQFLPSAYLEHAVDGDGDGAVDLWASAPDALASAARYVANLGWVPGYRWGREVMLPDGFDYALTGRGGSRPLSAWRDLQVRGTDGDLLPALDIDAAILVPSGGSGPAFAVYENFDVIMRWNRSEHFALSVGHLADRIAGAGPLTVAPPEGPRLTREDLREMQLALAERGFEPGEPDGVLGPATRAAIREFQSAAGLPADGHPTPEVLTALQQPHP